MRPEDILHNARTRRRAPRDWSVIALWGSVFVSVTMITGTLMWNLGKTLRIESYLRDHGVETCSVLSAPPGTNKDDVAQAIKETCEEYVTARHQLCLDETVHIDKDLRKRRSEYMTCVMSTSQERASLHTLPAR